jgi:hypothetical protein
MAKPVWLLLPLGAVLYLPIACSGGEANDPKTPLPPMGGPTSASGGASSSGSGGASASGAGGGDSSCKVADCPTGGFCKEGMCACSAAKPEVCMGANVGGGANGICTNRMTDPNNCGECGMKCEAGAVCVEGACGDPPVDIVTAAGCGTMRLALQGTNVYFTESMTGKVMTAPLAGGAAMEVATGQLEPTQIAADATGVYWVNQGDDTAGSSKVMKKALPLAAGDPVVLKASPDMVKILAITVADGKLYYGLGHEVHAISTDEAVTTDEIVGIATDFDNFPPDGMPSGEPAGLAVKGMRVFWTTATRQGVESDDILPGIDGYEELGDSQGSLLKEYIASDGTNGFWVDGANFRRAAKKPLVDIAVTPDFDNITAFAINATDVYFAAEMGSILKHDLMPPPMGETPSAATPLAREQLKTTSLVLDANKVFWASDCVVRSGTL